MKYIRTKDGRIFDTQPKTNGVFEGSKFFILNENELLERYPEEYGHGGMWCCRYLYRFVGIVEKQADTIEELCDEFVILPLDQNKRPLHHFLRTPRIDDISHFINDSHIIYGAIWTDKGLIYVAKMNEKGELKLL